MMQEAGCSKDAIKAVGKARKAEAVAQAEAALRGKTWLPTLLRAPQDDEADDAEAMAIAAEIAIRRHDTKVANLSDF